MNKKSKTRLTSPSAVVVLGLCLWASLYGRGYTQAIDMDAAKREGELVFYSATRVEDTDQLVKAFMKKYLPSSRARITAPVEIRCCKEY